MRHHRSSSYAALLSILFVAVASIGLTQAAATITIVNLDGPGEGLLMQAGFVAGETRHFQIVYREDPSLSCMRGQNSSNGYSVTFVP